MKAAFTLPELSAVFSLEELKHHFSIGELKAAGLVEEESHMV